VAVIGAGIMGSAMTRNLLAAGVNTRVWDGSPAATAPLAAAGAVVAPSAREAVRDADVVITMLPTADAVDSMIFDGGVADAFADAYMSILIEGVAETMELADRLGIGHQELADAIEGGPLDAPIADAKLHKMDRGDYAAEFPLEWALKDVDLAIGAVAGQAPPLLAALSGQWHAAVAAGHGRQDISAARLALGSVSPAS
jgi:3-hydroxyisobutyrate dehydrogenase-like beta-hydroxyacid dehydrogenase